MRNTINQEYYLAVLAILFSSAMWGLVWYPMRWLEAQGISAVWTMLVVYLSSAIAASLYLWQVKARINMGWPASVWALALAAGMTNLAFPVALTEGQVMRVMLLFYLSPLWSVILGHWWLGERISSTAWLMILVAMSGTMMMLWHPQMGFPWPHGIGDWLALFASVMFSINNVLSRKLAAVAMEIKLTAVFWGVVIVALAVLLLQHAALPQVSMSIWASLAVIGGMCFTAMAISVLYGLARMPVFRSAILMLFELVVAAVSVWWLTDERMSSQEWLGGILILLAGIVLIRQQK